MKKRSSSAAQRRISPWLPVIVAGLGGMLMPLTPTSAFKPFKPDHGHRFITRSVLSNGYSYQGKSVASVSTTLSTGRPVAFTDSAIEDVTQGNWTTDWMYDDNVSINGVTLTSVKEFLVEIAHCDNETIFECSRRIATKLNNDVLTNLKAYAALSESERNSERGRRLIALARLHLGKSLHTLQDFYAHSDHANRKNEAEIYGKLYNVAVGSATPFTPGINSNPYTDAGRNYNECQPMVGGNYVLTPGKVAAAPPTTGFFAPGTESVMSSLIVGGAYPAASDENGAARCDHGAFSGANTLNGINKDDKDPVYGVDIPPEQQSLMRAAHVVASYQAAQHTARLVSDLIAAIKSYPSTTDDQRDVMIAGLLGVDLSKPAYGFVVDTTGSMSPIINGVITQIQKLIDDSVAAGKTSDQKFMLLDYGDPNVGTPFIGSAADVKSKVGTLFASGGGDCPELTQTAVSKAVEAAPENSSLYVFTDASAKDASLADKVATAATKKKIAVTYVASGSCSPIDPTYYSVAAATGGQVLVTDHTAAGVAAGFTGISIENAGSTLSPVLVQRGTLNAARTLDVVVESGASRLTVVATADTSSIAFIAPDGSTVGNAANVVVTDFLGGRGVKVTNPVAGVWKVQFGAPASPTAYSVKADVASPITLDQFTFTETVASGRLGHESYAPHLGMPPIGPLRYEARLTGGVFNPVFEAVSEDGTVLSTFTAEKQTEDIYAGNATLGAGTFRVRVTGTDGSGKAVVRVLSSPYTPRKLGVRFVDAPRFVLGGTTKVYARISNGDTSGTVTVTGSTNFGTVTATNPSTLTLASGTSGVVELTVALPATADPGITPELALVTTKDSATESAALRFDTVADTDGDGVADVEEMGPSGTDPLFDGNGDGKADAAQPEVISLYSRSRNAYVTMGITGPGRFALAQAAATPQQTGGRAFPLDLFDFKITGLSPGAATQLTLRLPAHLRAGSYAKYGPLPGAATATWYSFEHDGTTGAKISGQTVVLDFVDGARGDDDLSANGEIVDIGGPVNVTLAGVKSNADDISQPGSGPTPATPGGDGNGGDSGGSGGCTIGKGDGRDMSLLMLVLGALGFGAWRRRQSRRG